MLFRSLTENIQEILGPSNYRNLGNKKKAHASQCSSYGEQGHERPDAALQVEPRLPSSTVRIIAQLCLILLEALHQEEAGKGHKGDNGVIDTDKRGIGPRHARDDSIDVDQQKADCENETDKLDGIIALFFMLHISSFAICKHCILYNNDVYEINIHKPDGFCKNFFIICSFLCT